MRVPGCHASAGPSLEMVQLHGLFLLLSFQALVAKRDALFGGYLRVGAWGFWVSSICRFEM